MQGATMIDAIKEKVKELLHGDGVWFPKFMEKTASLSQYLKSTQPSPGNLYLYPGIQDLIS